MSLSISLRYCLCKCYASRSMRRIGWCIADIDHWLTQYLLSCIKNSFILHQPLTDWGLVSEFFKYLNPSFATHLNWSHKYQWMLSSGRPAQDYIFRFPVKSQKQLNGLVVYNVLKADMQTVFTIFRSCHILGLSLNHTCNTQKETASMEALSIKRFPNIVKHLLHVWFWPWPYF